MAPGRYATLALASEVYYGRELRLHEPWGVRRLLVARNGSVERLELEPGADAGECAAACDGIDEALEVWDVTDPSCGVPAVPEPALEEADPGHEDGIAT